MKRWGGFGVVAFVVTIMLLPTLIEWAFKWGSR